MKNALFTQISAGKVKNAAPGAMRPSVPAKVSTRLLFPSCKILNSECTLQEVGVVSPGKAKKTSVTDDSGKAYPEEYFNPPGPKSSYWNKKWPKGIFFLILPSCYTFMS